jgi:hypothetical protein
MATRPEACIAAMPASASPEANQELLAEAARHAGAIVRDLEVAVSDVLSFVSTVAGHPLDGIIGYTFLRRFRVTIDYPRARLTLTPGR